MSDYYRNMRFDFYVGIALICGSLGGVWCAFCAMSLAILTAVGEILRDE